MGWNAGVFGELRVAARFDLVAARDERIAEHEADGDWPFDGTVEDESVGDVLDRWSRLRAPEYGVVRMVDGSLQVAAHWDSGTLLDEGGSLLAVLSALGALGAQGKVHVVGFGEDHAFAVAVGARGTKVVALGDAQHRVLAPKLAQHLDRPTDLPAPVKKAKKVEKAKTARSKAKPDAKTKPKGKPAPRDTLRELVGAPPYTKKLPSRMQDTLNGLGVAVGKARDEADIPWLVGLLRHPTYEVRYEVANALLYFDAAAALAPVVPLLRDTSFPSGLTMAAVCAAFKLGPERAVDTFAPLLAVTRKAPGVFEPAMLYTLKYLAAENGVYDYGRLALPRDVVARDPRWHYVLVELAGMPADSYSRMALHILTREASPRLCDALIHATRIVDARAVEGLAKRIARVATREAIPTLRRAAADRTHPHAARLGALADRLAGAPTASGDGNGPRGTRTRLPTRSTTAIKFGEI